MAAEGGEDLEHKLHLGEFNHPAHSHSSTMHRVESDLRHWGTYALTHSITNKTKSDEDVERLDRTPKVDQPPAS